MSKKKKSKVKKDPAYMVRESEMKSHIDRLLKNNPDVRKAIQEEARRANLEEAKRQAVDIDTLILMSLRKSAGFGRKRLLRFAKVLDEVHKYFEDQYEDCDMYAMRKRLFEETGIDVEHLDEEVAKYAEENPN